MCQGMTSDMYETEIGQNVSCEERIKSFHHFGMVQVNVGQI